jgi:hypothetical protein
MKLEMTNEEMQNIYHFIRQNVYELKYLTSDHKNIIVAIPSLVFYFFKHYPMYEYRGLDTPENELSENLFCGVKTQAHFNNEIVVFYTDYYRNPELFNPRIYQLKFVED